MTLTVTLLLVAEDRAEALVGQEPMGSFDPRSLLIEHPIHLEKEHRVSSDTYGQRLLSALGGPTFLSRLRALPLAPNPDSVVVLNTDNAQLAAIPWEYLHTGTTFVAFEYFLVREVPVAPALLPLAPDPALPWRLVVMASDPLLQEARNEQGFLQGYVPLPRLRVASELDALRDAIGAQQPPPPLRWHRIAPTRSELINLASSEPILFHYTGHGSVVNGQPVLCFDDGAGTMRPQPVRDLAVDLRGRTFLAFLNACRTADSAEPGANLALSLVQNGVPAVVGMQTSIRDDAAAVFADAFYQQLAAGEALELALYRARLQLADSFGGDPDLWGIPAFYRAVGYQIPRQRYSGAPLVPVEPAAPRVESLQAPARLLGRETELAELMRLFVFENKRVVTIRGPGGMGKTALVHELASRLRFRFREGIVAVTLAVSGEQAGLSAAALRAELARRLNLRHPAFDDPAAVDYQEEVIVGAVHGQRMLLIFDNYETVLGALGRDGEEVVNPSFKDEADAIQRLVTRLARDNACLLFTSRQAPVDLPSETCYPDASHGEQLGGLDEKSAITLFRERAGSRTYSTALPGQVAQDVGFSPLSIQLAASRWATSGRTEREFLDHLGEELLKAEQAGVPFHQRSVLVNTSLSIDTLNPVLQQALLELSIVANPVITPLHAAVVWGLEDETQWFSSQAHDQLEQLQDRSLLQGVDQRDEARNRALAYTFQPQIAQVVRSRAEAIDLEPARARYASWAAQLIGKAYGEGGIDYSEDVARSTSFYLPDVLDALPYRPKEQCGWDAWRAAIVMGKFGRIAEATQALALAERMAHDTDEASLMVRVQVERANQAVLRGDLSKALEDFNAALVASESEAGQRDRAPILHAMAGVLETRGDLDGAMRLYEQAREVQEGLGDVRGKSATLHQMAGVLETRGDLDGAMRLYEQAREVQEGLGDVRGKSATLHQMAGVLETRGDLDGAMRLYEQAREVQEGLGDVRGKSATLHQMAGVLETRGDLDGAMRLYEQAREVQEGLGDVRGKSATLHQMAGVLETRGDLDGAMRLYEQAREVQEGLGDVRGKSATLHQMAGVLVTRGDLDGAMRLYEQAKEIDEGLGDVRGKSATLHQMAGVLVTRGDLDGAMRLYEQAKEIDEGLGDVRGKSATLHQMAGVLETRGDLDGAMRLYEQAKEIDEGLGDVRGKSATLHQMAGVLETRGDLDGAMRLYEQAREVQEGLGDVRGKSATLHQMAGVLVTRGDLDGAMRLYEQAREVQEGLGDVRGKSATLHQMAGVLVTRGDLDGAMRLYEQAREVQEGLGDVRGKSATLHQMAGVLVTRGDLDGAMRLYEQAKEIDEGLGDVRGKSATLHQMAGVLETRGDLDGAMRLYEQAKEIDEGLGDVRGKSATLHQMAGVLETRGDLDGAMRLYEQSLTIKEGLGDVQGKAATLINMAQLQVMAGDRERALSAAREGVAIFEQLRAPRELAQAREILTAIESWTGEAVDSTSATTASVAARLVAMTTAALRGRETAERVRALLREAAAKTPQLIAYVSALVAVLDRAPGAANDLLVAVRVTLDEDTDQWAYGDTLTGIGNIAGLLDDPETELAARLKSVTALRGAPDDARTPSSLRTAIRNLSVFYYNREEFAAALPLMEEALALAPPGESDEDLQLALATARQRARGEAPLALRATIATWRDGPRDEESLGTLLNQICNHVIAGIREGSGTARAALAEDLAFLRAARPLPIPGANEFLHTLQLWLRDEAGMAERAAQLHLNLPSMFQSALSSMEQMITGASSDDDNLADSQAAQVAEQLTTMLEAAPPERRRALSAALTQVASIAQASAAALTNPQVTAQERALLAARVEELADEATAGEQPGSPWLDAATALQALSALLGGRTTDVNAVPEPFRTLLGSLFEQPGDTQ